MVNDIYQSQHVNGTWLLHDTCPNSMKTSVQQSALSKSFMAFVYWVGDQNCPACAVKSRAINCWIVTMTYGSTQSNEIKDDI